MLTGIRQGGPHERIADPLAVAGAGYFSVLEVEDVVGEIGVEEIRLSIGEGYEETLALGVVSNHHQTTLSRWTGSIAADVTA
jgi:hypothetical protein